MKKVKDVMAHIDEYNTIDVEAPLKDALQMLRKNHEKIKAGESGKFHKTLLVTDLSKKIVGKLSIFDLIRGLVPQHAKTPAMSRPYYRVLSSRVEEVADQVGAMQDSLKWLQSTFEQLVKEERGKRVKDVMSPIHPLLAEDDNLNKAIYVMFKENIRQPLVTRGDEIVGVVNIADIFPLLLDLAGGADF